MIPTPWKTQTRFKYLIRSFLNRNVQDGRMVHYTGTLEVCVRCERVYYVASYWNLNTGSFKYSRAEDNVSRTVTDSEPINYKCLVSAGPCVKTSYGRDVRQFRTRTDWFKDYRPAYKDIDRLTWEDEV